MLLVNRLPQATICHCSAVRWDNSQVDSACRAQSGKSLSFQMRIVVCVLFRESRLLAVMQCESPLPLALLATSPAARVELTTLSICWRCASFSQESSVIETKSRASKAVGSQAEPGNSGLPTGDQREVSVSAKLGKSRQAKGFSGIDRSLRPTGGPPAA